MSNHDSNKKNRGGSLTPGEGQTESERTNSDWSRFPVIGIGASAGGLEALEAFLKRAKPDMNAAFVIITHLDPTHPSMMTEILAKYTEMEVIEAQQHMLVEPNKVYIIPPGKIMSISHRALRLSQRPPSHEPPMPIDFFFRSLAEDQTENAIAVILSGNGNDGTDGLRSVQANLGIVLVQDPNTAKYPSMPQNAINTGLSDFILPPEEMPDQISEYYSQLQEKRGKKPQREADVKSNLSKIMAIVKRVTGHDFSHYKMNTICRRIERRMSVHQIRTLSEYQKLLEEDRQEVNLLFKEFLIQVTKFFRDPEAFESLKNNMKKLLLSKDQPEDKIRIWVPGCSTGEEAYSIAIMVKELFEELDISVPVHIFGTDIDEDAIVKARTGEYPVSIVEEIGESRISKFFVKEEEIIKVHKDVREMVVFAPQDVTHDPPFVRLDIISCRNLLIYFEPELQKRVLDIFSYALNPHGLLFLGTSESVDGKVEDFHVLDSKNRIYQRKSYQMTGHLNPKAVIPDGKATSPQPIVPVAPKPSNITASAEHTIINHYCPPAVVIDADDNIIYFHGRTGKFLEPAVGRASLSIRPMLREDIQFPVEAAIREGRESNKEVVKTAVRVTVNGDSHFLNIIVRPITSLKSLGGLLVVFQEITIPSSILKMHQELEIQPDSQAKLAELEEQLRYSKESLQSTIEELETSNEELKSTNEELQSTNEELQSIAEESETTKEELNSLNEELLSVNSELETKNRELMVTNGDMRNLLNSIDVATIFLDNDLHIKRFTPQISKIMNLLPTDAGRPLTDISISLQNVNLAKSSRQVLEDLNTKVEEVQTFDGRWYLVRIIPYRTMDSKIDGVVITFIDIDSQKKYQEQLATLSAELNDNLRFTEAVVNTISQPILVLDENLSIVMANRAFIDTFRVGRSETLGNKIYNLGNKQWDIPKLRELLEKILPRDQELRGFVVESDFPIIGHRKMSLSAKRLDLKERPTIKRIILAIDDITSRS